MPDDKQNFGVRPNCCKEVQSNQTLTVFLSIDPADYYDASEDRGEPSLRWVIFGLKRHPSFPSLWLKGRACVEMKCCPFCGKKMPELEKAFPPGPICKVTDGGYHCDTCGERLQDCQCYGAESCWKPKGGDPMEPEVKLVRIEEEAVVFRAVLEEGAPFVPQMMVERANEVAGDVGRNVVLVEGDFIRTRFIVDTPLSEDEIEKMRDKFCETW